jgi:hypothetical protein
MKLETTRAARLLVVQVVMAAAGCHDGSPVVSPTPPPATSPLPVVPAHAGHYRGVAAIGEATYRYHAEALFTADDQVVVHVGGPVDVESLGWGAGVPAAAFAPLEAALFVGDVTWDGSAALGHGIVIGERCGLPSRYCGTPAPAHIFVSQTATKLTGEIRVTTAAGVEVWALDILAWSFYRGSPSRLSGMFRERLAPFAESGEPIITIDRGGRLFFQSAASGCTGNGTVAPHGDGRAYVVDVVLVIANCDTRYAYLNGRFEGLGTATQNNYWDEDNWLVMWLATPSGGASQAALTLLSEHI